MNDDSDYDENSWLSGRPLSNWELQCIQELERTQANIEAEARKQESTIAEKLWALFQNTATSIAQMHKDKQHSGQVTLWIPFQHAATNATTLYKACVESSSLLCDMNQKTGMHKRNRDLVEWTKSRPRRTIRREELLAFLAGCPPPSPWLRSQPVATSTTAPADPTPLHDAFREALRGVGRQQGSAGSPSGRGYSRPRSGSEDHHPPVDRKRPASTDVTMDSPTHKRTRFI